MAERQTILMIAGFGDDAGMFDNLRGTALDAAHDLRPVNLPGFGAPPPEGEATLAALAIALDAGARASGARVVLAHSVASIVAALAAGMNGPIDTILSVEGNLTADDAYFSGTAADHPSPESFRAAFLARLDGMAKENPVIGRYREAVSRADPRSLWQLGRDARRHSEAIHPGEELLASARVTYLYDPPNCPAATLEWLERNPMPRIRLPGASHWPSVDAPDLLSDACLQALRDTG